MDMNSNRINEAIAELLEALKTDSDSNCVNFELHVNAFDWRCEFQYRTQHQIESSGISMPNLRGEWI